MYETGGACDICNRYSESLTRQHMKMAGNTDEMQSNIMGQLLWHASLVYAQAAALTKIGEPVAEVIACTEGQMAMSAP